MDEKVNVQPRRRGNRPDDEIETRVAKVPVIEEHLSVEKRVVPGRTVRIDKRVEEHTVKLDEMIAHEEVEILRRTVERVLTDDEKPAIEQRDGVTVIPIVEERLVVRKERVLKEELLLRRRTKKRRLQDEVPLRRERVTVSTAPPNGEVDGDTFENFESDGDDQ